MDQFSEGENQVFCVDTKNKFYETLYPLPTFLWKILCDIRSNKNFNPSEWIESKTDKLNEYMKANGLSGCVVAVSGGIDSAVTYYLAKHAMQKNNSPIKRIIGLTLPINSTKEVWSRALELEEEHTFDIHNVGTFENDKISIISGFTGNELSAIFKDVVYEIDNKVKCWDIIDEKYNFAKGQLKSYLRTPINYYVAQLLSAGGYPAIVLGTGNKDEDRYLCYFCKAGDGVVDVQLISDLHKSEVFKVGKELKVPDSILHAPPTADLWDGQTDENELGFGYDFVELLLTYHDLNDYEKENFKQTCIKNDVECGTNEWDYFIVNKQKAELIHQRNRHKLNFPINL